MKKSMYVFVFFVVASLGVSASPSAKKCSPQNMQILISKSASMIGEMGNKDVQVTKLFTNPEYSKTNLEELRKQYLQVSKESSAKSGKIAEEIANFVAAHPECDQDKLFSLNR